MAVRWKQFHSKIGKPEIETAIACAGALSGTIASRQKLWQSAMFAAIRRAPSRVSSFAAVCRPGSSSSVARIFGLRPVGTVAI
jgi:hypothetical protein